MTGFDVGGFDAGDLEEHARRAVAQIAGLARRAARFATTILVFTVASCVIGFVLGWQAFDGSTGWAVLGGFFAVVAIGAALIGRWRVGSVKRHVPALVDEMKGLLFYFHQATTEVIDTFVVEHPDGTHHYEARVDGTGAFDLGRTMLGYRGMVGDGTQAFGRLTATITALTSYPILALTAVLISLVFVGLSVIFAFVILL